MYESHHPPNWFWHTFLWAPHNPKKRKQDLLSAKQAQPGPPTVPSHSELLQAQRLFPLKATQGKVKEAIENTHKVFS